MRGQLLQVQSIDKLAGEGQQALQAVDVRSTRIKPEGAKAVSADQSCLVT